MTKKSGELSLDIKVSIEEIYNILCPGCKEKLLTLAAQSGAISALEEQLKRQWEKK